MKEIPKVDLQSKDIKSENIDKLRQLFPEIFTEGKIDFDKLKLTLGEEVDLGKEKYGMSWPGKARCFQIIQDRTTGTLKPVREESVDFDTTKNLFIEGDNLEVLKILQKSYFEKIKMIYIDPPYNTGKDFVYKDKFGQQLEEYLKLTNQVDSEGKKLSTNTDSDGRYHSNWMNMMYPRLYLARNLLKEDGVIFISIDDNEVDNLKKICNEIFGEENFIADIIWQGKKSVANDALISLSHTHNITYAKNKNIIKKIDFRLEAINVKFANPDNDPRGNWVADPFEASGYRPNQMYDIKNPNTGEIFKPNEGCCWKNDFNKFQELIKDKRIWFGKDGKSKPMRKRFWSEADERGRTPITIWSDLPTTTNATVMLNELLGRNIFDYPKPIELINRMLQLTTKNNASDIVLDFFAGSGTTAHSVLDLNQKDNGNRQFILVQFPEITDPDTEAFKAGYKTISDISKERIRQVIKKIKDEQKQKKLSAGNKLDLGFKVFKLDRSNFKLWDGFSKDIQKTLSDNVEQIKKSADKEATLYELLLKEGFSLTEDIKMLKISDKLIYSINDNQLLICLEDKLTLDLFKEIKKLNPTTVIVLDKGFNDNDQLKTNAVELMTKVDNDTNKKEYLLKAI